MEKRTTNPRASLSEVREYPNAELMPNAVGSLNITG